MVKTPEQIDKNRQHHLTFWRDEYMPGGRIQYQYAAICMDAEKLLKELETLNRKCVNIEQNRRQNAVEMGCTIRESDAVYNMDKLLAGVPKLIETIKERLKQAKLEVA